MSGEQSVDELVTAAAEATISQQSALLEAQRARQARSVAIWRIRAATRWSSAKIARKIQGELVRLGVTQLDGIGVSHDNVRRVVEGPEPVE